MKLIPKNRFEPLIFDEKNQKNSTPFVCLTSTMKIFNLRMNGAHLMSKKLGLQIFLNFNTFVSFREPDVII